MITKNSSQLLFAKLVASYLFKHGNGVAVKRDMVAIECMVLWALCHGSIECVVGPENKIEAVAIGRRCDGEPVPFDWQENCRGSSLCVDSIVATTRYGRRHLIRTLLVKYPDVSRVFGYRKEKLVEYRLKDLKRLYDYGNN